MESKKVKKYRFRRWLRNWLNNFDQDVQFVEHKLVSKDETIEIDPMIFKIYRANGGTVVETRRYDRQKDRNYNQLHIVAHDRDLGESIGKIITMESLRG